MGRATLPYQPLHAARIADGQLCHQKVARTNHLPGNTHKLASPHHESENLADASLQIAAQVVLDESIKCVEHELASMDVEEHMERPPRTVIKSSE